MKSKVSNTSDEIEIHDVPDKPFGRVRIREQQGSSGRVKCSVLLEPDQLEEHAQACLDMAGRIRGRVG
jgi:hypothetical protein